MRYIELTLGQVTWVDDWNYNRLNQWEWSAQWSNDTRKFYAKRSERRDGNRITVYMHREIMGTPKGMKIDHINGNTLLNLESNLRVASNSENSMNRGRQRNNRSGYKGVSWDMGMKMWYARITVGGRKIHIGYFEDIVLAAKAYDQKAKELHGEFARLNFP